MRNDAALFKRTIEDGQPMRRLTGTQMRQCAEQRKAWLLNGGTPLSNEDPVRQHGVKRLSALFSLPY